MLDLLEWRIVLSASDSERFSGFPRRLLTIAPQFRHEGVPDEVSLLLPTNEGPQRLIDTVVEATLLEGEDGLGLFLANPFLNLDRQAERLEKAGIRWIANLPSVEQQDEEFTQQLADVGLDRARELDCLTRLRAAGFRTLAVVSDAAGAVQAVATQTEGLIVIPRIADFAAGFPSSRQRGDAATEIADAAAAAGWNGPLLGLGDRHETDYERLWPDRLTGLLCRPTDFRRGDTLGRTGRIS